MIMPARFLLVNIVLIRYYLFMSSTRIYRYLERLSNLLRNESRRGIAEYGLQPVQLEALHYLSICNRYSDTPMAVTEYLGQTKGTVSQTLKVLLRNGLLVKKNDSKDKRITHLKVSANGRKILIRVIPGPLFDQALDNISAGLEKQIINSLDSLLASLQNSNNMKTFGVCSSCVYNQKIKGGAYFCNLTQEPLSSEEISLICREHQSAA